MKYLSGDSLANGVFISFGIILSAAARNWSQPWADTSEAWVIFREDFYNAINPWGFHDTKSSSVIDLIEVQMKEIAQQWTRTHQDSERLLGKMKTRRIHRTDFDSMINVRYLPDNEFPSKLQQSLLETSLEEAWNDESWINDSAGSIILVDDSLMEALVRFNDNPLVMERRYHVEWTNKEIGFGVIADVDMQSGEMLDIYTGNIICGDVSDAAYQWVHPDLKSSGDICGIEAREAGNIMRFVNDDRNYKNVKFVKTTYHGRYYVLYSIMNNSVQKGQHLSVSYGSAYWNSRRVQHTIA